MAHLLTPGTHVLKRDHNEYQLGLGPELSVRLNQAPADDVDLGQLAPTAPHAVGSNADALRGALPAVDAGRPWERHAYAALYRSDPARMAERLAARGSRRMVVRSFGPPISAEIAEDLRAIGHRCGLTSTKHSPYPLHGNSQVVVVVGVGEPDRVRLESLVRHCVPHLFVRWVEGKAVVGPFVSPGLTPCLRCLDRHAGDLDPLWPLLVAQYSRVTRYDRADGIPEPLDPALVACALGWAARDVVTYLEGGTPTSEAATITLEPGLAAVERAEWTMHTQCTCG